MPLNAVLETYEEVTLPHLRAMQRDCIGAFCSTAPAPKSSVVPAPLAAEASTAKKLASQSAYSARTSRYGVPLSSQAATVVDRAARSNKGHFAQGGEDEECRTLKANMEGGSQTSDPCWFVYGNAPAFPPQKKRAAAIPIPGPPLAQKNSSQEEQPTPHRNRRPKGKQLKKNIGIFADYIHKATVHPHPNHHIHKTET